jgi:hypothetical protein
VTKIPFHFVYRDRKEPSDEHRSQKNDPATVEKGRIADAISYFPGGTFRKERSPTLTINLSQSLSAHKTAGST